MHFEITASLQSINKHLTSAQRNSSLFSEAPRIGATTLRRGQVLKFDQGQMKHHEVMLKRLFDAGAIEIFQVDGKSRVSLRDAMQRNKTVLDDVKQELKKEEAPPEPPKVETKKEEAPPPPPEPSKNEAFPTPEELVAAVAAENKETEEQIEKVVETALTPAEEAPSSPPPSAPRPAVTESKGKKGKR